MKNWIVGIATATVAGTLVIGAAACAKPGDAAGTDSAGQTAGGAELTGTISIDGSSTVQPISAGFAEAYNEGQPKVEVTVGRSGTGGGFKKFCNGEIEITGASRAIEDEEVEACSAKQIEFVEIPIAFDGLSVVVNPENDWAKDLTVAELKKMWEPNSSVKTWADVRAGFPKEPIKLYGAGTDSGTFDYFTKAIVGKEKSSRPDYQASEDDNTLVQGVAGDKYALGYFGYAYFDENKDKLKLAAVEGVTPSPATIADGTYKPLSRPLFFYVAKTALDKPQVVDFLKFALTDGKAVVGDVGYVPLTDEVYALALGRVEKKEVGTVFHGAEVGMKIEDLMKSKPATK